MRTSSCGESIGRDGSWSSTLRGTGAPRPRGRWRNHVALSISALGAAAALLALVPVIFDYNLCLTEIGSFRVLWSAEDGDMLFRASDGRLTPSGRPEMRVDIRMLAAVGSACVVASAFCFLRTTNRRRTTIALATFGALMVALCLAGTRTRGLNLSWLGPVASIHGFKPPMEPPPVFVRPDVVPVRPSFSSALPAAVLVLAVVGWLATLFVWFGRRRDHSIDPVCFGCGYSLIGNESGFCPECGAACRR